MEHEAIIAANKDYWNGHADLWFGTTALPQYGVKFVTGRGGALGCGSLPETAGERKGVSGSKQNYSKADLLADGGRTGGTKGIF